MVMCAIYIYIYIFFPSGWYFYSGYQCFIYGGRVQFHLTDLVLGMLMYVYCGKIQKLWCIVLILLVCSAALTTVQFLCCIIVDRHRKQDAHSLGLIVFLFKFSNCSLFSKSLREIALFPSSQSSLLFTYLFFSTKFNIRAK